MKKVILIIVAILIGASAVFSFNYFTLVQPALKTIDSDSRNNGIELGLHYKNYVSSNVLIFNLKEVSNDKAVADVFRVLLQTASALKEKEFESVELAFKGMSKFKMEGTYFKELGVKYENQNPLYTMRTLPENLLNVNGEAAYSKWTGGLFGVLNKQMDDFNDFHKKWYLEELSEKR